MFHIIRIAAKYKTFQIYYISNGHFKAKTINKKRPTWSDAGTNKVNFICFVSQFSKYILIEYFPHISHFSVTSKLSSHALLDLSFIALAMNNKSDIIKIV